MTNDDMSKRLMTETNNTGEMIKKLGERSPTRLMNRINNQNDEDDNLALLKLIRGGYVDQNVVANMINNVLMGFTQQNTDNSSFRSPQIE